METTMIRTNGLDLLKQAQAAMNAPRHAKVGRKVQSPTYGPPTPKGHDLDMLHKMVGKVQKDHKHAVRALGHWMDTSADSAIDAYTATKVLLVHTGHQAPTFATFLNNR